MSFKLAFTVDYGKQNGGELGRRIYKHYIVKLANKETGAYIGVEPEDYSKRYKPEYKGLWEVFQTLAESKSWLRKIIN